MHSRITHVPGEVRVVFELSCLYSSDLRLVVCIIAFHRVSLLESFKGKKNNFRIVFSDWWFNFAVWPESCRQAIESCDIRRKVSSLSEAVRLKSFITFLPFQVSCEMKILALGCRLLADSFTYSSVLGVNCVNVAASGKLSASTGDCTDSVSMWSVIAAVSMSTDVTV